MLSCATVKHTETLVLNECAACALLFSTATLALRRATSRRKVWYVVLVAQHLSHSHHQTSARFLQFRHALKLSTSARPCKLKHCWVAVAIICCIDFQSQSLFSSKHSADQQFVLCSIAGQTINQRLQCKKACAQHHCGCRPAATNTTDRIAYKTCAMRCKSQRSAV